MSRKIEAYKAKKPDAGLSAKTVNNHWAELRHTLAAAGEWGRLALFTEKIRRSEVLRCSTSPSAPTW